MHRMTRLSTGVVAVALLSGCSEPGSWGGFEDYRSFAHRTRLDDKPQRSAATPPPASGGSVIDYPSVTFRRDDPFGSDTEGGAGDGSSSAAEAEGEGEGEGGGEQSPPPQSPAEQFGWDR